MMVAMRASTAWSALVPMLLAWGLGGCASKQPQPHQPWKFEARTTHGVVRVLPVLALVDDGEVPLQGYVGARLPWLREWLRGERTDEVGAIPDALGTALPGAINGELGARWDGQFLGGHFAPGSRRAIRTALQGSGDLDEALSRSARGLDGSAAEQAVLVTWVTSMEAEPLTARGFAGEIVHTAVGPVVLDHIEEPFLVDADLGMALVAHDGEVVLRYSGRFETVLSGRRDATAAATDLARALATEVAKVWATDPRLEDDAVSDPVAAL
jgi:hypothetical protein